MTVSINFKKLDFLPFLLFVFLCVFFYISQRPLWLDEKLILENIIKKPTFLLLGPLENSQAFPRVYLILIKIFAQKLNYHILVLRFFPLISMLVAFFIWQRIYKTQFYLNFSYLLGVLSFLGSWRILYYSNELKPYSLDVLIVGCFVLYLINQKALYTKNQKLFIFLTLLLPFTILFSYASFFMFWLVFVNLFKNRKNRTLALLYIFLCLLFFAFVFYLDLQYSFKDKGLINYWNDYFLCTTNLYCFLKSFGEGIRKLVVWWFSDLGIFRKIASFFIPFFAISLFGFGINSIKKFKIDLISIGFVIFLELFIFGIIKKYPFTGERITLFFAPFSFYFIIKSFEIFRKIKFIYWFLNIFYFCFIFASLVRSLTLIVFYI
ncbi:MAG: hypothetical protein NC935_07995 [Candidatus Omnitrophica bacterium]|nr:hypothetical protein [Candidatus Omnitrophota bacterium]